jgi:hypothetical protein
LEACRIVADKMLTQEPDTTTDLIIAGGMAPAGLG